MTENQTISSGKSEKNWCPTWKNIYFIVVLIAICYRFYLVSNLPIFAISGAAHDDRLMANGANFILEGNWLGDYSVMTLIKGPFFPLFLAFGNISGLSYTMTVTLLYTTACVLLIYSIKPIIKNSLAQLLIFILLLYNPITMSLAAFQRVYRNSITGFQVLFIIAGYFGLLVRINDPIKKIIPWSIFTGLAIFTFWITREDSIWILPLILFVILTAIIFLNKNNSLKTKILKIGLFVMPLLFLEIGLILLSWINYSHYGVFTYNELNKSNFTKAIRSIYSVKPNVEIPFVSVPRETLARIIKVSPSLQEIFFQLENSMNNWTKSDTHRDDLEVEDGWFFWALRDAVNNAGYYTRAVEANEFYLRVSNEIEEALSTGQLDRRFVMPSALMSPWRTSYTAQLPETFIATLRFLISFNNVDVGLIESISDGGDGIRYFESITGNHAFTSYKDPVYQFAIKKSEKINKVSLFYRKTGSRFFLFGFGCFIISFFIQLFCNKERQNYYVLIFLISLLIGICVLVLGISYSHISAFPSINYMYLSGGYPLTILFSILSVYYLICQLSNFYNKKKAVCENVLKFTDSKQII